LYSGEWVVYFESGQIKQRGRYLNGKSIGKWSFYHPNGNVWKRGSYVNDLQEGMWLYYHEFGILENVLFYEHGLMKNFGVIKQIDGWEKVFIKNGEVFPLYPKEEIIEE
jgi:antitoxin component YwqK of YwqJK toxin-antitoxin module